MTYSSDFRRKVLSVREQKGLAIVQVAVRFCVGIASVTRWIKNSDPQVTCNKPATKIDMVALAKDVEDYPDAYQHERAQRLGEVRKALATLCGVWACPIKKTLRHPRADEGARRIFKNKIDRCETQGRTVIYIDESGFSHDMPRTARMPSVLYCINV